MFKTQYQFHDRVIQPSGERYRPVYSSKIQPNGDVELVESGSEDVYAFIQSHRDSTDINVILSRFENGDLSALNQRHGSYFDLTVFPKTYAETLQMFMNAEQAFYNLPVDIRDKFDHDLNKFVIALDDPQKFNSILNPDSVQSDITSVGSVKEVESDE